MNEPGEGLTAGERDFLRRLETAALSNARFGHREHLKAAYLCLQSEGYPAGAERLEELIRRFAAAHGHAEKFHLTLTLLWARLVAAHIACDPGRDFEDFLNRNAELRDTTLPLHYYSAERLRGERARQGWCEPDLRPLPATRPWKPSTTAR